MPDLVYKQVRTVIDGRTTYICLHAAGQTQPVGTPFDTLAGKYDAPPFHRHCRSIVVPWIPGMVNTQRDHSNRELQRRPKEKRDWRKHRETVPPPDTETDTVDADGDPVDTPEPTPIANTRTNRTLIRRWRGRRGRRAQAALRGRAQWDDGSAQTARALAAAMRPLDQPVTVYRNIRGANVDDYAPGTRIVDRGFVAGTTERGNLQAGGTILQILAPAGSLAVVTGSMGEIILAHGTPVVVTGVVAGTAAAVIQAQVMQP